ncbi:MAG TPA: hypothetical protein PKL31_14955 [Fulvivirga sp.]|nr:hypothetical protein [Fulvivirga sp.]
MKNIILILLLISGNNCFSQDQSKIFEPDKFVWCGLDFSLVKFIGAEGFSDPTAIKNHYFSTWNQLVIDESYKYDFTRAYQKEIQINDFSVVNRRNQLPKVDNLIINTDYSIEESQIKAVILDYQLEGHSEGLGLVYIYETLNKTKKRAVIHRVFFDIATKETLWQQKLEVRVSGFGFRNYWVSSVLEALRQDSFNYGKKQMEYKKQQRKNKKNR